MPKRHKCCSGKLRKLAALLATCALLTVGVASYYFWNQAIDVSRLWDGATSSIPETRLATYRVMYHKTIVGPKEVRLVLARRGAHDSLEEVRAICASKVVDWLGSYNDSKDILVALSQDKSESVCSAAFLSIARNWGASQHAQRFLIQTLALVPDVALLEIAKRLGSESNVSSDQRSSLTEELLGQCCIAVDGKTKQRYPLSGISYLMLHLACHFETPDDQLIRMAVLIANPDVQQFLLENVRPDVVTDYGREMLAPLRASSDAHVTVLAQSVFRRSLAK